MAQVCAHDGDARVPLFLICLAETRRNFTTFHDVYLLLFKKGSLVKHNSRLRSARFLVAAALFSPGLSRAQQLQYNISTVAGTGTDGYSGDNATANQAELSDPCGIAVDSAGNIYIADQNNNRIRKAAPGGNITTAIGNGTAGFTGDGGSPTQAEIMAPCGVAVDAAGDIYFSQTDSNGSMASAIRELAAGNLNTVATACPQRVRRINRPEGLAVDSAGNLYIADTHNYCVRAVKPA
jgi:NHL repeat